MANGKTAGTATWTNTGTSVDTVADTDGTTSSLYFVTFTSDPGAPADWWITPGTDTLFVNTGANVTGTPTYNWLRIEKD